MIDVKHHSNASGTAFIDFTKEGHQPKLPGTHFFFPYVIDFPLYLSCSFSERRLSGFWICIHRPLALASSFHLPHFTAWIAGRGLVALY